MYITVFRNRKRGDFDAEAYAVDAARMEEMAAKVPGFRSIKSFHADDGEVVTISEWDSEESAKTWGRNPDHLLVQSKGRAIYYECYTSISMNEPSVRSYKRSGE